MERSARRCSVSRNWRLGAQASNPRFSVYAPLAQNARRKSDSWRRRNVPVQIRRQLVRRRWFRRLRCRACHLRGSQHQADSVPAAGAAPAPLRVWPAQPAGATLATGQRFVIVGMASVALQAFQRTPGLPPVPLRGATPLHPSPRGDHLGPYDALAAFQPAAASAIMATARASARKRRRAAHVVIVQAPLRRSFQRRISA
mmetsp:Transcript_97096/g.274457  ORF Transcript_97096/g.274457 Transcript_97096/m.274457 type:complete len:200 (+) Transcript_97096:912-1511(+)